MKKQLLMALAVGISGFSHGQTLYVPGGLVGTSVNGNVGIGTNNPQKKLHLTGTGDIEQWIEATDDGYASFSLKSNNKKWHWSKRPSYEQDALRLFYHDGAAWSSPYMSILPNGNMGIGTNNPLYELDVEGSGRVKNSSNSFNAYTTFRIQGPNYEHGLEIDFFGNDNITSDISWSYGGGKGAASIVNVNPRPLVLGTNNQGRMLIDGNGNVGIGTTNPGNYKLNVWGRVRAHEIVVNTTGADFVFENTYRLRPLKEVEQYIQQHKHLPEISSALEMQKDGVGISELQTKLLQKIEELTLYVIDQEKRITTAEEKNATLEGKSKALEQKIAALEKENKALQSSHNKQ